MKETLRSRTHKGDICKLGIFRFDYGNDRYLLQRIRYSNTESISHVNIEDLHYGPEYINNFKEGKEERYILDLNKYKLRSIGKAINRRRGKLRYFNI